MAKNKITLNVLADITRKINNGDCKFSKDKVLIVFNGSNINLNKRINELKKLQEDSLSLSLAFSFMAERIINTNEIISFLNPINIYGEGDIFDLENILDEYSKLIMPNITMNTLSKVALGMIDSFASNILWAYLYRGKEVYLDFISVKNYLGKPCENKEINSIINSYIKTIKSMGAMEIDEGKYIEVIMGEKQIKGENINIEKDFNKVITEKDLSNYSLNVKTLKLSKGSILTPLAKDKIRELGIKVEIES